MSLADLVTTYGYAAVFVGTLLEGETVVVLAGLLAHQGYLGLAGVVAAAFGGSFLADQALFHLGRRFGLPLLERWPRWQQPAERAFRLLRRFDAAFIFSFRFLYGLRTVSPFVIGASGVGPWRFLVVNGIAAAVWAATFGGLGYVFGRAIERLVDRLASGERVILVGVVGVVVLLVVGRLVWRWLRRDRPR